MNLDFKPLIDSPWILNSIIPVNDNFHLSINNILYNYKVTIQVGFPSSVYWDIVKVSKNISSTYPVRNDSMIHSLLEMAETLKYAGEIEVFTIRDVDNKLREWKHQFF